MELVHLEERLIEKSGRLPRIEELKRTSKTMI